MEQQKEQCVERSNEEIILISSDDEEQQASERAMQSENSPWSPWLQYPESLQVSVPPLDVSHPWHSLIARPSVSPLQSNHHEVSNAANITIDNHQIEQLLPNPSTSDPVYNWERSHDASQVKECQKRNEVSTKNVPNLLSYTDSVVNLISHRKRSITHPCAVCGRQFKRRYDRNKHMRIHTGEKPYKCTQCNYDSNDSSNFAVHKRKHSAARPFKCLICKRTFKLKRVLADHQKTHSVERPFKCLLCDAAFKYKRNLIGHQRTHDAKPFEYSTCKRVFASSDQLTLHQVTYTDAFKSAMLQSNLRLM